MVTFAIGEKYQKEFQNFKPSIEAYCKKYDWDFIEVKELFEIVEDRRFIICQKLLIACQEWSKKYEAVVWVDSDMWITDNCPEIPTPAPGKIGICIEQLMHHECLQVEVCNRRSWQTRAGDYYKNYGFEPDECPDWLMNAGLMAFRTDMDIRPLYDEMVEMVRKIPECAENGTLNHYEQPYLGWKLFKDNAYEIMDWRYNIVWPVYRCMFAEPYDSANEIVKPMVKLFDFAYTVHFTDREDLAVFEFAKKITNFSKQNLVVSGKKAYGIFSSIIRLCNFKNIYVVPSIDPIKEFCPLAQYGWVFPKNIQSRSECILGPDDVSMEDVEKELNLKSPNI